MYDIINNIRSAWHARARLAIHKVQLRTCCMLLFIVERRDGQAAVHDCPARTSFSHHVELVTEGCSLNARMICNLSEARMRTLRLSFHPTDLTRLTTSPLSTNLSEPSNKAAVDVATSTTWVDGWQASDLLDAWLSSCW